MRGKRCAGLTVDGVADEEEDDDEVADRGRARFGSFKVGRSVSRNRIHSSALLGERAFRELSRGIPVSLVWHSGGPAQPGERGAHFGVKVHHPVHSRRGGVHPDRLELQHRGHERAESGSHLSGVQPFFRFSRPSPQSDLIYYVLVGSLSFPFAPTASMLSLLLPLALLVATASGEPVFPSREINRKTFPPLSTLAIDSATPGSRSAVCRLTPRRSTAQSGTTSSAAAYSSASAIALAPSLPSYQYNLTSEVSPRFDFQQQITPHGILPSSLRLYDTLHDTVD